MNDCSCGNGLCTDCARDMQEVIRNVLKLHRPVNLRGFTVCQECTPPDVLNQTMSGRGRAGTPHPCRTVKGFGGARALGDFA
jgi:hypothetical protein